MNIVFQASAGTGKTHQVTHLYASMLLARRYETADADGAPIVLHDPRGRESADPRRILLMTFTDNAAAELRTRVTELILKARQEAEDAGNSDEIDRTVRMLRALPSAPICTIHSFCASFLREHALEAGISPAFAVLDQNEAEEMLEEVARDELIARLNPQSESSGAPADPDFAAFCGSVRVMGGDYGSSVADTARNLLRQADSKGLSLDDAERMLPPATHTVTASDFLGVLERFRQIRSERGGKLPDRAAKVFQTLEKIAADFPGIGETAAADPFIEAMAAAPVPSFSGANGLTELNRKLKELRLAATVVVNYRLNQDRIRSFARYAAAVSRRYTERKLQLGVLDFDDLLVRARDLLRKRDDAAKLFDCIIVDEVQDTSRVQSEIIERLWDPAANGLVICGDAKQSIYAWRNADPRVMLDLAERISATPRSRAVALRASFRSKDLILDLVNRLFARVYEDGAYRDTDRLVPSPGKKADVRARGEGPCVELIQPDREAGDGAGDEETDEELPDREQRAREEMTAIARRIRLLVGGPGEWSPRFRYDENGVFERADGDNAFRYSDIFILLRRTTNQQILEHVLRQHGIPYRISGRGRGLFARPEAKDVLLFFRVLLHPFDTISLLGFLRSPWAGLSDDVILQLGWQGDGFDEARFRRNVLAPDKDTPTLEDEQARRLERARRLIDRFKARLDEAPLSELLRALVAETGYDAVVAGSFRGGQRLCNLRKLMDWIRTAERGGTVLPADVCALLQSHADNPPDVPEATMLDPDQNAVTIMTIHAAKGLTARVVFVPETGSSNPGESAWAILDTPGAGVSPALQICAEDLTRNKVPTPGFEAARERIKDTRAQEAKNLFYVAMTRARDLVVVSGAKPGRTTNCWRARVDELIASDAYEPGLLRGLTYGEIAAAADARRQPAPPAKLPFTIPAALEQVSTLFPRPLTVPRILRYSATALAAFHAGRPSSVIEAPSAVAEDADEPAPDDRRDADAAAAFGTAGHAVLEQLALRGWNADTAALVESAASAANLPPAIRDELRARVERCVPVVAREAAQGRDRRAEWPFAMTLDQDDGRLIVDGTLDLLYTARDGRPCIVDYKFTDDDSPALVARYGLQLNLYRVAVSRLATHGGTKPAAFIVAVGSKAARVVEVPDDDAAIAKAFAAASGLARMLHEPPCPDAPCGRSGRPKG